MYWLKRTLSKSSRNPNTATQQQHEQEHHGITDELINLVKSFTIDTFKNFPLQGCFSLHLFFFCSFSPKLKKMLGVYGSHFKFPIFIIYLISFDFMGVDEDESSYSEEVESTSTRVRKDLSQWQERHAVLILSNVKVILFFCLIAIFVFVFVE